MIGKAIKRQSGSQPTKRRGEGGVKNNPALPLLLFRMFAFLLLSFMELTIHKGFSKQKTV